MHLVRSGADVRPAGLDGEFSSQAAARAKVAEDIDHGFTVVAYNRTTSKGDEFLANEDDYADANPRKAENPYAV